MRLGTDLFGQVGQRRLAPELALNDFAAGLGSMNISRVAKAKLTETFAVSLQKAAARQQTPAEAPVPVPASNAVKQEPALTDRALDITSQGVSGLNIGLAQGLGAPVDLVTLGLNLVSQGIKASSDVDLGEIEDPFFGSQQLQQLLDEAGTIAPPSDDPTVQFVRRVGEGAGSAVGPGAVALKGLLTLAQRLGPQAFPLLQQITRAPGRFFGAELGSGTTSGVGAAIANQIAPDSVAAEIVGEFLGGLLGANAGAAAARAARGAARPGGATKPPVDIVDQPDANAPDIKSSIEDASARSLNPQRGKVASVDDIATTAEVQLDQTAKSRSTKQNPVERHGRHRTDDVDELPIDNLIHTHPVPRPNVPPNHIDDLARSIREKGFDRAESIPVFRMPDGKLILADGNHRLAAMKQLGQETIPARVFEWFDLARGKRILMKTQFPKTFDGYSID